MINIHSIKDYMPGIGHNSGLHPLSEEDEDIISKRDISKQVIVKAWRRAVDCLAEIPAKYLLGPSGVLDNENNFACCRTLDNLSLEIRKTQDLPEIDVPDLYVFKCDCNREHLRVLCVGGHFGLGGKENGQEPVTGKA